MTDEILSVVKALAVDLARSNMTQAQLGTQLDITQQAIEYIITNDLSGD